ncbi:arginine N-succinyltransferase [Kistimonas scapharcae]|uniref:Arginine N-succinyltransferase n=1 Tax=Kistimonas scapharcae TaxID=1036133 RepID=A0ABP8V134_9GAMM
MMVIRPIKASDWDALWDMAHKTGVGFTSLQPDEERVLAKLQWALESFDSPVALEEALYLFVLEDTTNGKVAGICAIESAVGMSDPWYNYRVNTQVHSSRELGVYNKVETLTLCNDHTGYSELCTLFLLPEYRHSRNGHLLSKSRFLFMAEFPRRFSEGVIAEMRGYSDENGVSPFWEALGRHFFSVDFAHADQATARSKVFVAELMPRHPIYLNLLPEEAQQVVGLTHDATTPARKLLESEGMRYSGCVAIFDAGPLMEARIQDIRLVRESRYFKVHVDDEREPHGEPWLLANTKFHDYRCAMSKVAFCGNNIVCVTGEQADALRVDEGDTLRVVHLLPHRAV